MFGLFFLLPSTRVYENKRMQYDTMYARFRDIKLSYDFKRYEELKEYVESQIFKKELAVVRNLSYNTSKERLLEKRYKELLKYPEVKRFRKTGVESDAEYVNEYIELNDKIWSPSFLQHKAYLKNKKRYMQSDPYIKFIEYKRLSKSEFVRKYYKIEKKYAAIFAEMERWTTVLYDEFADKMLSQQWDTKPYWQTLMLEQNYSPNSEYHLLSDGANISLKSNMAQIITRREEVEGVAWDENMGFIPRDFAYTSGMLSTAHRFQMKFGKLEAKLSFPNVKNVYHIFGLGSGRNTPEISIAHYCNKRLITGAYLADKISSQIKKIRLRNNHFYIFRLERTTKSLKWFINDKKIYECKNMTNEPLYIAFASGIIGETENHKLPAAFEIDYIKLVTTKQQ